MKIQALMIPDPITISENASIANAIDLMKQNRIRHLPVVGGRKILKGFLTLADLKRGLIPSMLGDLSLTDLIIRNPITVTADDDIETAAQLIYNHKISGIPVVKGKRLVGIITETDLLRTFIDMLGILTATSRIDVEMKAHPSALQQAMKIINHNGGDIINAGISGQSPEKRIYYFRLAACKTKPIQTALESEGFQVLAALD